MVFLHSIHHGRFVLCVCIHVFNNSSKSAHHDSIHSLPAMHAAQATAAYVLTAAMWVAGADLDPLQVLEALSEEMPLSAGVDILSHLLCERLHRHRQGSIIRSLHKACTLSASVDRAEVCCCMYTAVTVTAIED